MKIAPPVEVQWLPVWSASEAFGVKILAEYGRNEDANITRLTQMADRLAGLRALVPRRRDGRLQRRADRGTTMSSGGS